MSLLVLGATGTLGRQIVRKALNEGFHVKCFVRNFRKASFLKEWGAELIYGDLALPETIPITLYGITAIIDASTTRVNDLSDINKTDLYGKYILIQSAIKAKIKKYIFFSIINAHNYNNMPLISLKLKIEKYLIQSGLNYTIFNLTGFFQGIITQYAVPILDKQSIWITGESTSIAYMNTQDIAKIVIKSLSVHKLDYMCCGISGKQSWASLDIVKLCEKISGQRANIIHIPLILIQIMKEITNLFQWSWTISERLAFVEILSVGDNFHTSMQELLNVIHMDLDEIESLEGYLSDYFATIMNKLKELNYEKFIKSSDDEDQFKF